MQTIEERAKEWGEHIVETTTYDVVNGKACVFVEDRNIADVAEESYIAGATEQKAIDVAVRLKKCDDMTQEECDREAAFAEWYRENGKGTPTCSDAIEWAEQKQTEEMKELNNEWMMTLAVQKQKIITKAYKWLKARNVLTDDSLIGFRKAMEE